MILAYFAILCDNTRQARRKSRQVEHKEVIRLGLFGLSTNQEAAVSRAENELRKAEDGLRDALATLNNTPRSQNQDATAAVRDWQRRVQAAKAALRRARASLF